MALPEGRTELDIGDRVLIEFEDDEDEHYERILTGNVEGSHWVTLDE